MPVAGGGSPGCRCGRPGPPPFSGRTTLLDSRRLLYFLRIVELGSFSQAALKLGVAQPALSHHIRLLEDYLGVVLLVRRPRGVSVTEAGEKLLAHARIIVGRLDEAERELRSNSLQITGTVALGLASSVSASLTPLLLREVGRRQPGIVLHIMEATSTSLTEWIRIEQLDLAVNLEGVARQRAEPLFSEDLYLVGAAGSEPAATADEIAFKDVAALPLILPTRPHSMRTLVERTAIEHGLALTVSLEINGFAPLKAALEAGLGFSILSWAAVQNEVAAGRISARPIVRPSIRRAMVLESSPGGRSRRATLAIREITLETIAGLFAAGIWRGALRFAPEPPGSPAISGRPLELKAGRRRPTVGLT